MLTLKLFLQVIFLAQASLRKMIGRMIGLKFTDLKQHKVLIPLYTCLGLGYALAAFYLFRLAVKNPDVSWKKRNGITSNDEYVKKQYKFYSPTLDYKRYESPIPNY